MSTLPALIIDSLLKTFLQPDRMPTLSRYGWALFTSLDERGGIWGEGGGVFTVGCYMWGVVE